MHIRFGCRRGCQGTEYKVTTTKQENGEDVKVCKAHGEPVERITKSMVKGHAMPPIQPKKPPFVGRRIMMMSRSPALVR